LVRGDRRLGKFVEGALLRTIDGVDWSIGWSVDVPTLFWASSSKKRAEPIRSVDSHRRPPSSKNAPSRFEASIRIDARRAQKRAEPIRSVESARRTSTNQSTCVDLRAPT